MTISYSLTRLEILRTYLFVLPRSPRILTVVLIVSVWPGFVWLSSKGAFSHGLSIEDVVTALVWMVGAFSLLLFWIFLRAKTKVRTLSISERGIYTEIGRIKADCPWSKVKEIKDVGEYVIVVNRTGNAFFIPNRAFTDTEPRAEFIDKINQWCAKR
jgi:YcxB-like protein